MLQTKNKPKKSKHLGTINLNEFKKLFHYCFRTICLKLCHIYFIQTTTFFVMVHLLLLIYKIEKTYYTSFYKMFVVPYLLFDGHLNIYSSLFKIP